MRCELMNTLRGVSFYLRLEVPREAATWNATDRLSIYNTIETL